MERTFIKDDYSVQSLREDFNYNIERTIKREAQRMFEYMEILERNVGNILVVKCGRPSTIDEKTWPQKEVYIVGRIAKSPIAQEGTLSSNDFVYTLDYDLSQGKYPAITKENIVVRSADLFPFKIWDLIHPREFNYETRFGGITHQTTVPIKKLTITDDNFLLECLKKLI